MSNPTTPFSWQMPTATDLVTDLPADFEVFGQAVATSMADLLGGTSGQILAKNSNTDMDFVWIANDQGDITAVTAGTGISGGGTSGAVTITNSMATEITAKADLIVGTGNAAFDNLPVGADGTVLTADSTVSPTGLKWATPGTTLKGCLAYRSAANGSQSVANNTFTSVLFPSEQYDTDGYHSTVTNTNRMTIPAGLGGYYLIIGGMRWDTNASGYRRFDFEVNGGGNTYAVSATAPTTASTTNNSSIVLYLAAGDWVGMSALQTSGGSLNALGADAIAGCYLNIIYLGA